VDQQAFIERLVKEYGYSPKGALLVWGKVESLNEPIHSAINQWWEDNLIPGIAVQGYTVELLVAKHAMNPIAAFLTLDWLIREPEKALASLNKGHDKIIRNLSGHH
jgi:hypothetical protein